MATVLVRAFELEEADIDGFSDVKSTDWFSSAIANVVKAEMMKGTSANYFSPERKMTREQAFATLARALKLDPAEKLDTEFPDADQMSNWAKDDGDVYAFINLGFIKGNNAGELNPTDTITRAEMTKIVIKALEYKAEKELAAAESAVVQAEKTKTQEDVDAASALVNELIDSDAKDELIERLNVVQAEIDALTLATVTLDVDGAEVKDGVETETTVRKGSKYKLLSYFDITKEGYTLKGWLNTSTNEEVTGFRPEVEVTDDVTYKAIWEETTGKLQMYVYSDDPEEKIPSEINLIDEDGNKYALTSNQYGPSYRTWNSDTNIKNGEYTFEFVGLEENSKITMEGSVVSDSSSIVIPNEGTEETEYKVNLKFKDNKSTAFTRVKMYLEDASATVTLDVDGAEVKDGVETETTVRKGSKYKLLSYFDITKEGYTLKGWLNTSTNEEVTGFRPEVEVTDDVTYKAIWEETTGKLQMYVYSDDPEEKIPSEINLIDEDGNKYALTSNQYGPSYRTWNSDTNIKNGEYTFEFVGLEENSKITMEGSVVSDSSSIVIPNEGTEETEYKVNLKFKDNKSTAFTRVKMYIEDAVVAPEELEITEVSAVNGIDRDYGTLTVTFNREIEEDESSIVKEISLTVLQNDVDFTEDIKRHGHLTYFKVNSENRKEVTASFDQVFAFPELDTTYKFIVELNGKQLEDEFVVEPEEGKPEIMVLEFPEGTPGGGNFYSWFDFKNNVKGKETKWQQASISVDAYDRTSPDKQRYNYTQHAENVVKGFNSSTTKTWKMVQDSWDVRRDGNKIFFTSKDNMSYDGKGLEFRIRPGNSQPEKQIIWEYNFYLFQEGKAPEK